MLPKHTYFYKNDWLIQTIFVLITFNLMYHQASASCIQASKSTILYLVFGNMLFLFWHSSSEILEFDFFSASLLSWFYISVLPILLFFSIYQPWISRKSWSFCLWIHCYKYAKCCIYIFWSCSRSIEAYLWSICMEWNYFWILSWLTDFKFSDSFPLMYGRIIASLQLAYKSAGGSWY